MCGFIARSLLLVQLPEPLITERDGGFLVELFKDRFLEGQLKTLDLNERQIKSVLYVKEKGKITNSEYQELTGTSGRTALRDLRDLISKRILEKKGEKKSTQYILFVG